MKEVELSSYIPEMVGVSDKKGVSRSFLEVSKVQSSCGMGGSKLVKKYL